MENNYAITHPIIDKERFLRIIELARNGNRLIPTDNLSLDDWLSIRNLAGLGGSEIATVLNINQYETPFELWKKKVSDEIEVTENDYMYFGNLVEPALIEWYNRKMKGQPPAVKDNFIRIHPEHDCLFVNLDGVIYDKENNLVGIVECKSTSYRNFKSWETDTENCAQGIPLYMYCQVQHELSITGLAWCDLAILITDRRQLKILRINRDEEYIGKQNKALVLWWNAHVVPQVPPEMTAKELSYLEPMAGSFIEATTEIQDKLAELRKAKEDEKICAKKVESLEDEIKLFIGDNENIVANGEIVATWKSQTQNRIDTDLIKKTEPEIFERFKKVITFRILRLKKEK